MNLLFVIGFHDLVFFSIPDMEPACFLVYNQGRRNTSQHCRIILREVIPCLIA